MSHQRPVIQIQPLTAVFRNNRQILLHCAGIHSAGQNIFQLIIKSFQRKNCLPASLAACHQAAAVHAKDGRFRQDTAFLIPVNGQVRNTRRGKGQFARDLEMGQLDLWQLQLHAGEKAADLIHNSFDRILRRFNRLRDGGLDPIPHRSGGTFDAVEHAGYRTLYRIKHTGNLALDAVHHRGNDRLDPVPHRRSHRLNRIKDRGHGIFDGVHHRRHLAADGVPDGTDHVLDGSHDAGDHTRDSRQHGTDRIFDPIPNGSDDVFAVLPDKPERQRDNVHSPLDNGAEQHHSRLHHVADAVPDILQVCPEVGELRFHALDHGADPRTDGIP